MKIELEDKFLSILLGWCAKGRNVIVTALYFFAAHLYDGICYVISNALGFLYALIFMFTLLFLASILIVIMHEAVKKKYSWDICDLEHLNKLRDEENIPSYKIFKRFTRWTMRKGYYAIYFIVPWTIGPFVSAILLRKDNSWKQNLIYVIPGTLMSALVWVTIWTGVGVLTWNQYIIPAVHRWMA